MEGWPLYNFSTMEEKANLLDCIIDIIGYLCLYYL